MSTLSGCEELSWERIPNGEGLEGATVDGFAFLRGPCGQTHTMNRGAARALRLWLGGDTMTLDALRRGPEDIGKITFVPTPDRLTMSEQLRLIEIAHAAAPGGRVQAAALDLLAKAEKASR